MSKTYKDDVVFCAQYLKSKGVSAEEYEILSSCEEELPFEIVKKKTNDSFFTELANGLRELWPPGGRVINGKEYAWRDSVDNIAKRLKALWQERFSGDNAKTFTVEECLSVARCYLAQFEMDTKYMLSLSKFIWKQRNLVMRDGRIKHVMESKFADMLDGKVDYQKMDEEWNDIFDSISADQGEII